MSVMKNTDQIFLDIHTNIFLPQLSEGIIQVIENSI